MILILSFPFNLLDKITELAFGTSCPERYIKHKYFYRYLALGEQELKVLDIGCGQGGLLVNMAQKTPNHQYFGVDADPKAIQLATAKAKHLRNIKFLEASALKLPFKDQSFDRIISTQVLEHMPAPFDESFFLEADRVLKTNCLFILDTPADGHFTIAFQIYNLLSKFHYFRRKYKLLNHWHTYRYYPAYQLHRHIRHGFSPAELSRLCNNTSLQLVGYHYYYKQGLSNYFQLRTLNRKFGLFYRGIGFLQLFLDETIRRGPGLGLICQFYKYDTSQIPARVTLGYE
ncbi:class I SAM-dependent methyltransferase [Chloroflexota bacterium]